MQGMFDQGLKKLLLHHTYQSFFNSPGVRNSFSLVKLTYSFILALQKSKIARPLFDTFSYLNSLRFIYLPFTFKHLYNAAILSHFLTLSYNADVVSAEPGLLNVVSSTLLAFGVSQSS